MVKESKILFTLGDLTAIHVRCRNCANEVILRPGPDCIAMPKSCCNCGGSWVQGNIQSDLTRQLIHLLSYIQTDITDPSVNLQFELNDN